MPASWELSRRRSNAGEHVERDRQDLERDEDHDEVVGRGHRDHAERREQHQREVLGPFEVFALHVGHRDEQRERGRAHDDDAEEHAEAVDAHHPGHGAHGTVVADALPLPEQHHARRDDTRRGERVRNRRGRGAAAQQRARQHDEHRGGAERDLGRDREPVDVRRGDVGGGEDHFDPPACLFGAAATSRSSAAWARGSRSSAPAGRSSPSPWARCGRARASGRGRGTGSARAAARPRSPRGAWRHASSRSRPGASR